MSAVLQYYKTTIHLKERETAEIIIPKEAIGNFLLIALVKLKGGYLLAFDLQSMGEMDFSINIEKCIDSRPRFSP